MSFESNKYEAQVFFWLTVIAIGMIVAGTVAGIAAWHGHAFTAAVAAFISGALLLPCALLAGEFVFIQLDG